MSRHSNTFLEPRVLRYFSYTSIVRYELCSYREEVKGLYEDEGCRIAKDLYEECVEIAQKQVDWQVQDNKSAFEIVIQNRVLYVGFKDGYYRIGLGIYGGGGNRVYDFLTKEWSDYGNHEA